MINETLNTVGSVVGASALIATGIHVLVATNKKDSEPIKIIGLPEMDYIAEGHVDEDLFVNALQDYLKVEEGLGDADIALVMLNTYIVQTYMTITSFDNENFYAPAKMSDPGAFPVTMGIVR